MALAKRIAFNVAYNSAAKVISTVLALVSVGFITRYLGKEGFGSYSTVLAFFAFFSAAADLGIYSIATREISRSDANESRVMSDAFSLRLLISLTMLLAAPLIAWALPYSPEVSVGIIIAAATFVFASSYGLLNGLFQKHIAMNRVATAELIGKIIQVALVALVVSRNLGFISIILAFFLSTATTFVIVFVDSRKFTNITLRWSPAAWRVIIRESLPMGISVFVTFLYFKLDTILLSVMRPSADVGIYGVAYKVIENLTFFPGMVVGLVFPLFSRHIFSDPEQFRNIANKVFKIFIVLVIPLVIGMFFLADVIIAVIGGSGFPEAALVLRILAIALAWIFFGNFFNNILIAGNLQKKMMFILSGCAAFNLSANLFLIPRYSYLGAAVTSAITEMLVVLLTFYVVKKYLAYAPTFERVGRALLSGIVMAGTLFVLLPVAGPVVAATGATALYFFLLWLTHTITNQELRSIFAKNLPDQSDIISQ